MEKFAYLENELMADVTKYQLATKKKFKYSNRKRKLVETHRYSYEGYCEEKQFTEIGAEPYSVKYSYDNDNKLIKESIDKDNYTLYEYDNFGRVSKSIHTVHGLTNIIVYTYHDGGVKYYITSTFCVPVSKDNIICETKDSYGNLSTYILDKNRYIVLNSYTISNGKLHVHTFTYNDKLVLINDTTNSYVVNGDDMKIKDTTTHIYNENGDMTVYKYSLDYGEINSETRYEYEYEEEKTTQTGYHVVDGIMKPHQVTAIHFDKDDKNIINKIAFSTMTPPRYNVEEYEYSYYK